MALADRVYQACLKAACGTLRLPPEDAEAFATHVASANAPLQSVASLYAASNTLQSATIHAILLRWFAVLPEYELPRALLMKKPGAAAATVPFNAASATVYHARMFEVSMSQQGLAESQALEVATHLTRAATAFHALAQTCSAPERCTQKQLCTTLRAALAEPLERCKAAAEVYLAGGPATPAQQP